MSAEIKKLCVLRSKDSAVGVVTKLQVGRQTILVYSRFKLEGFLFFKAPYIFCTLPSLYLVDDVAPLHEVKTAGSEADHALPSSAGVKKKWSCTSTHPHDFKARVGTTVIFRRVRKIAKKDYSLRRVSPSAWNNLAPTRRIFMKFYISVVFENSSRKFKFH
jgi:hypothetical protein